MWKGKQLKMDSYVFSSHVLKSDAIFSLRVMDCTEESRSSLAKLAVSRTYRQESLLYSQGSSLPFVGIVRRGEVSVYKRMEGSERLLEVDPSKRILLGRFSQGTVIGQRLLKICGVTETETAQETIEAASACQLLTLSKNDVIFRLSQETRDEILGALKLREGSFASLSY